MGKERKEDERIEILRDYKIEGKEIGIENEIGDEGRRWRIVKIERDEIMGN